jgi:3-hydroxyisobutyrate dehydrogenase
MVGVSEAMNVGVKLGVDPKILASVINTSSGRCWSSDTYNPCPNVLPNSAATRGLLQIFWYLLIGIGYTGGFMADLMKKDLGLALEAASVINR